MFWNTFCFININVFAAYNNAALFHADDTVGLKIEIFADLLLQNIFPVSLVY